MALTNRRLIVAIDLKKLLAFVVLFEIAAIFIMICAIGKWSFYPYYLKPPFSLMTWEIIPIFYLPAGIAAYAINDSHSYLTKKAVLSLMVSFILNIVWAWLFFCAGNAGAAFAV